MKKYEVMYIIRPTLDDESRKALIDELNNAFAANNSVVDSVKEMGFRDLAYEIDGESKGYYVLLNVTATVEGINEFERLANIRENVIRHICVLA